MNSNLSGYDEKRLDKLISDIYMYAEHINRVFNSMDDLVLGTASYYQSQSGNKIRSEFERIKSNFPIIKNNLIGYAEDLTKVKSKFKNTEEMLTGVVNNANNNFKV